MCHKIWERHALVSQEHHYSSQQRLYRFTWPPVGTSVSNFTTCKHLLFCLSWDLTVEIAQVDLEPVILRPQLPTCWDDRRAPPCPDPNTLAPTSMVDFWWCRWWFGENVWFLQLACCWHQRTRAYVPILGQVGTQTSLLSYMSDDLPSLWPDSRDWPSMSVCSSKHVFGHWESGSSPMPKEPTLLCAC